MKLYRKVSEEGYFLEDVLIETIPYLTKEVPDTTIDENGILVTHETTHTEIITEPIIENIISNVWNEETQCYDEVIDPVEKQVPVLDKHYISEPCPEGFYHPKWNFESLQWEEGMTADQIEELKNIAKVPTTEEKLEELAANVNEALYAIMLLSIE